jgi:hypothetical protein
VAPIQLEGDGPQGLWDALAARVAAAGFSLLREETPGLSAALGSMSDYAGGSGNGPAYVQGPVRWSSIGRRRRLVGTA